MKLFNISYILQKKLAIELFARVYRIKTDNVGYATIASNVIKIIESQVELRESYFASWWLGGADGYSSYDVKYFADMINIVAKAYIRKQIK